MAEHLFIRLTPAGDASWIALDADGRALGPVERGPLADARASADGRRVVLLVPGTDVTITSAALPVASGAKLRKMLPYALEETLADDVEDLAFAVGPRLPSGAITAVAVAKERLERWLALLAAEGIVPNAAYADADGVPDTPGTLTLLIEGRVIYGRRPGQPPFVLEGLAPREVLEALAADGGEEQPADLRHLLVFVDAEARAAWNDDLLAMQSAAASCDLKLIGDGPLPRFAATLVHNPGTNLLQGAYAPKSDWLALAKPWRLAAGLLAAAIGLAVVGQAAEYWALARSDRTLSTLVADACGRVVGAAELGRCEAQVRARLSAAGATTDTGESFLATLTAVARSRGAEGRIENLSYRNRVLDLQLVAPDVPSLDAFVRRLGETGRFSARIESANQTSSGVEGRVQVVSAQRQ